MNSIPRVISLYLVRHFILFLYLLILYGCFSLIAQTKDEMVLIPEGVFTMGYNIKNKNEWGDTDEGPVHKVFLKPYYIDRYEVSASQFLKFLNHHQKKAHLYFKLAWESQSKKLAAYLVHGLDLIIIPPIESLGMAPMRIVAGLRNVCRPKRSGKRPLGERIAEFFHGVMSSQPMTGLHSEENLTNSALKP